MSATAQALWGGGRLLQSLRWYLELTVVQPPSKGRPVGMSRTRDRPLYVVSAWQDEWVEQELIGNGPIKFSLWVFKEESIYFLEAVLGSQQDEEEVIEIARDSLRLHMNSLPHCRHPPPELYICYSW